MLHVDVGKKQGDFNLEMAFEAPGSGVTALFGNSGAGKTSLINIIAGLTPPDRGRVILGQTPLFHGEQGIDLPPEKRRIGYVFQEGRLFPHLTVASNLTFGMKLLSPEERVVKFDHVVELLGIGHLLKRRPSKLSGGEKQRVAMGRALLTSPRLLLMDEPLASLDESRKKEVLPFIRLLAREMAIPILYVSHSPDEIVSLADSLVLLEAGRVVAEGPMNGACMGARFQRLTGRCVKTGDDPRESSPFAAA